MNQAESRTKRITINHVLKLLNHVRPHDLSYFSVQSGALFIMINRDS